MKIGLIFTVLISTIFVWAAATRTIDADAFRSSDRSRVYNLPSTTGSDDLVTVSGTQNVRNKTLISPNFSGTAQLGSSTFNGGTISGTTVSNASISGGTANNVTITNGSITTATINGPTISGGTHSGGTFTTATITSPTVSGGTITSATVSGSTISGATINTSTINSPTVSGGTITGGIFQSGTVSGSTTLSGTMTGGTLSSPTLSTSIVPSYIQFTNSGSDPSAPSAGSTRLYFKSTGLFYRTNSGVNSISAEESGTCTITVVGGSTAGAGTYSQQLCAYRKVGTLVTVGVYVDITAHTGTGNILFGGMPYTSASTYYHSAAIGDITRMTLTGASWRPNLYLSPSSTQIVMSQSADAVASTTVTMDTSFGILFTISYFTN
jgi:hypothetical protein